LNFGVYIWQFYRVVDSGQHHITEFEGRALYKEIGKLSEEENEDAIQRELAVGLVERKKRMPQVDAVGDGSYVAENAAVEDSAEEVFGLGHAIEDNDGAGYSLKRDTEGEAPYAAEANAEVGIEDQHEHCGGGKESGMADFMD
jgi:hypothetical protein